MRYQISFYPEARQELLQAKYWLEDEQAGLGLEFVLEFDQMIDQVCENPERFPRYLSGTRRCLVRRFKYLIVFVVEEDQLTVVAVAHPSRRPGYWRKRLK